MRVVVALTATAAVAGFGVWTALGFPGPWLRTEGAGKTDAPVAEATTAPTPDTEPEVLPAARPVEPSRLATITIAAAGDMLFDRKVGALVRKAGGEAPLAAVAAILAGADIAIANLESPLSSVGEPVKGKDFTFRGEPAAIDGLRLAGFDFLSLANNHALDYGPDALAETISLLDAADIRHAGAGADRAAAWKPAVVMRDGASVAFLSFSHVLPPGFVADDGKAGIAQGRANMDAVVEAIRSAKESHDYVLVSFHWGVEYADHANAEQVRDAHAAVDAGADMVLSHHPHVIQAVERYKDGLIAYSTGDFVFDHYSRKTGEAFIIEAELGPGGVGKVAFTPVYLDADGRPEVVTGSEAKVILDRLKRISTPRGGEVDIQGDKATLK